MRPTALGPFVLDRSSIFASDVNLRNASGDGIKAGGKHDEIKLPFVTVYCLDAFLCERFDWVFFEVNDVYLVLVKRLKVVLFETDPLRSVWMRCLLRCQYLRFPTIFDSSDRLLLPELLRKWKHG